MDLFAPQHFGFITNIRETNNPTDWDVTATCDNLTSANIRAAVYGKKLKTDQYILLYLYDPDRDFVSSRFLEEYGARLNNRLKADIPLFTVYPKKTFDAWIRTLSDSAKITLEKQFVWQRNASPRYDLMNKLAGNYNVKALPALVVIDTKKQGKNREIYTSASFQQAEKDTIFHTICDILDAIESNPYDFEKIRDICRGTIGYSKTNLSQKYERCDPMSLYNFFEKLLKQNGDTQYNCSRQTGISRGTLSNYMNAKTRVKLENAYLLAIYLHMTVDQLDWLICNDSTAKQGELDDWKGKRTKRIKAIVYCLEHKMGIADTNAYLFNSGLKTL